MNSKNNIYFFGFAFALFLGLKLWLRNFDTQQLYFLLMPTSKIVEMFTGSQSVFIENEGFYFSSLNTLIEKGCSGYNLWLLSFLVFSFLLIRFFRSDLMKLFSVPLALLGALFFTFFANASRIYVSVFIQSQYIFSDLISESLVHAIIGSFMNLFFLVAVYWSLEKLLTKFFGYEKVA
ncbi:MAG: exosortase K [Bergeyella sp.]